MSRSTTYKKFITTSTSTCNWVEVVEVNIKLNHTFGFTKKHNRHCIVWFRNSKKHSMGYKLQHFPELTLVIFSIDLVRSFGWEIASILFRTTIIFEQVISPMTRHSAVCVWMPLVMSTTKIIRSIIWAPPMMVLIREAEANAYRSAQCDSTRKN